MEEIYHIPLESQGQTALEYLGCNHPLHSVKAIKKWFHQKGITFNDKAIMPFHPLDAGGILRRHFPLPPPDFQPRPLDFSVIYEDKFLVVLSKPWGVPVIPSRDGALTLMEGLLHHWQARVRPRIVHRLDRETSGVMVVAKDKETATALSLAFEERRVEKAYLAFVRGIPHPSKGKISLALEGSRGKKKKAQTEYQVVETFGIASLVKAHPLTGRQHQIRIHLSSIGHPLLVDPQHQGQEAFYLSEIKKKYRKKKNRPEAPLLNRVPLHSFQLAFPNPQTGEKMTFKAPLPPDLERLHQMLKKNSP